MINLRQTFNLSLMLIAFGLLSGCSKPEQQDTISYYQAETQKPYLDVLDELKLAISDHNFRITAHSQVGHVISERLNRPFPEYDTIQFCNLTLARQMLEISPEAIRHMPCNIVTYQKDTKTVVQVRLLPTDHSDQAMRNFAKKMNDTLKKIVDFAVET